MKKSIITILFVLITISLTQGQTIWRINYDMGLPVGSFGDFVTKTSYRGFSINGNSFISDNITLGGTFSWQGFYEKLDRNTYEFENGALTSQIWKEAYILPLQFNAYYHFIPDGNLQPYAGLGLGLYYTEQSTQAGMYAKITNSWKFGLAPEAGIIVPLGISGFGLNAKVIYNSVFYNQNDISTLSYFTFSAGIVFISF